MFQTWLFRRNVKARLRLDYEYEIREWQEQILVDICAKTIRLKHSPGDAAAYFMEGFCLSIPQPLSPESVAFVGRASLHMMNAMTSGNASFENIGRSTRLLLFSQGAKLERLDEVDEILDAYMQGVVKSGHPGLVPSGQIAVGLIFEMAAERGLVPRKAADSWQGAGT